MLLLLVLIVRVIERPVDGQTDAYTADFTDANGLRVGHDVRLHGVPVGKVERIELHDDHDRVRFTVQRTHAVTVTTTLAIRYQSLTGERYVDVRREAGQPQRPTDPIPTARTVPSFDITTLFNGLQPVLAEFSPQSLNKFSETMLAVIEGDGDGIGPAFDAIDELSKHVTDRQQVISVLFANLRQISDSLGGRSPQLTELLTGFGHLFDVLDASMKGMVHLADLSPYVFAPINNMMRIMGMTTETNPDMDNLLRLMFPDPQALVDLAGHVPALIQSLDALVPKLNGTSQLDLNCSKGAATIPEPLRLVMAGQRISVCRN
jgi:phospholipid/cholesterol/gamma-HCH transport system substrate-binding protein